MMDNDEASSLNRAMVDDGIVDVNKLRIGPNGMINANLNDKIRFKPKPEAHAAFKAYWEKYLPKSYTPFPTLEVDQDGWAKMQMHEFIRTFGGDGFSRGIWCIVDPRVQIEVPEAAARITALDAQVAAADGLADAADQLRDAHWNNPHGIRGRHINDVTTALAAYRAAKGG